MALPILIVVLGLVLLVAEVFLPSGGALGIVALGLIVWGIWTGFQVSLARGWMLLLAVLLAAPAALGLAFRIWPSTTMGRLMILSPPTAEFGGGLAEDGPSLQSYVGRLARATSPLRPSGWVDCEGRSHDALAESGLISPGAAVVVVGVRAGALVVRELEPNSTA